MHYVRIETKHAIKICYEKTEIIMNMLSPFSQFLFVEWLTGSLALHVGVKLVQIVGEGLQSFNTVFH